MSELFGDYSTEQLRQMICQVTLEDDSDVDYLQNLLAAYEQRPDSQTADIDVDAAWEDFKSIIDSRDSHSGVIVHENHTQTTAAISQVRKTRRTLRGLVTAAVIAVLLFSLSLAAGAFPQLSGAIARWTNEKFTFLQSTNANSPSISTDIPAEISSCADMAEILEAYGITEKLVPAWLPDGYYVKDYVVEADDTFAKMFVMFEKDESETIIVSTVINNGELENIYEKDDGEVSEYIKGGVLHYIMTNVNNTLAIWKYNQYECYISMMGTDEKDSIIKIINSIYES